MEFNWLPLFFWCFGLGVGFMAGYARGRRADTPTDYKLRVLAALIRGPKAIESLSLPKELQWAATLEYLNQTGLAKIVRVGAYDSYVITDEGRAWFATKGEAELAKK